jgi:hypothetical protein
VIYTCSTWQRYTHSYQIVDECAWRKILPTLTVEVALMVELADIPVEVTYHEEESGPGSLPGFCLNGVGDDGHDSLVAPPPDKDTSTGDYLTEFTKTIRKPYDLTVCLILLRMKHLAGDGIIVQ